MLEIWFDGSCPLCQSSMRWCRRRDQRKQLHFRDFRSTPDEDLPLDRRDLEANLWVVSPDGRLLCGFDGWRAILARLPRWRHLARCAGLWPLSRLGRPLYELIARHRQRVPVARRKPPAAR